MIINKNKPQARNQEVFGAGEVSLKRGLRWTFRVWHTKEGPCRPKFWCFFSKILLNCILNENLTHRCTQTRHFFPESGHFFPKLGLFFSIFKKVTFPPPPTSFAPEPVTFNLCITRPEEKWEEHNCTVQ